MIMPSWSFPRMFGKHHGHSRLVDSLGAIPPSTNAAAIPYNRKISGRGLYTSPDFRIWPNPCPRRQSPYGEGDLL